MEIQQTSQLPVGCIRVVVADDSPEFLRSFQKFISTIVNVQLVAAGENGAEAVKLARQLRPELVILDLEMPGTGGLQAAMELRDLSPGLRIIIISAHDRPVWRELSATAGADAFITKPQIARELPEIIERLFAVDRMEMVKA